MGPAVVTTKKTEMERFRGEPASSYRKRAEVDALCRRLLARVAALQKQGGRMRERAALRAFPLGTRVRLTCQCAGESSRRDHEGEWLVLRWNGDTGNYTLTRPGSDETTYAPASSLERAQ